MPTVTAQPRKMSNGDSVTQFIDTVGSAGTTYTYASQQDFVRVKNNGIANVTLSAGGTTITIPPGVTQEVETSFTSLTLSAASNSQSVHVSTIKYNSNYFQLTGSNVTLASGVTTTGLQAAQTVGWASTLRLNIWGTATSFDVQVQAQMYDNVWRTLTPSDAITGNAIASDITAAGVYDFDVAGWQKVALNVVSVTGGNVNAQGALLP